MSTVCRCDGARGALKRLASRAAARGARTQGRAHLQRQGAQVRPPPTLHKDTQVAAHVHVGGGRQRGRRLGGREEAAEQPVQRREARVRLRPLELLPRAAQLRRPHRPGAQPARRRVPPCRVKRRRGHRRAARAPRPRAQPAPPHEVMGDKGRLARPRAPPPPPQRGQQRQSALVRLRRAAGARLRAGQMGGCEVRCGAPRPIASPAPTRPARRRGKGRRGGAS